MAEPYDIGAFAQHFPWLYQGNYFQATQIDPMPGFTAAPVRSVAPMAEPEKNSGFTKNKKKAASGKSSNQTASEALGPKQPKTKSSASKKAMREIKPKGNVERKNLSVDFDEARFDISGVPPPYCSCTGVPRPCHKGGGGKWQSSCCNSSISAYPLPKSPWRPGARVAGRKMGNGAYMKLLYKLASEGHDLSHPVDLKEHWAKLGTNKFVTIK